MPGPFFGPHRPAPEVARAARADAGGVVRRGMDEQPLGRAPQREDGQLLRQGVGRRVPPGREGPPRDGRQEVPGRRDEARLRAVLGRPRVHRRGVPEGRGGGGGGRAEGLVPQGGRLDRRAGLRRGPGLVRPAVRPGGRQTGGEDLAARSARGRDRDPEGPAPGVAGPRRELVARRAPPVRPGRRAGSSGRSSCRGNVRAIIPTVRCRSMRAALAFYTGVLDFERVDGDETRPVTTIRLSPPRYRLGKGGGPGSFGGFFFNSARSTSTALFNCWSSPAYSLAG